MHDGAATRRRRRRSSSASTTRSSDTNIATLKDLEAALDVQIVASLAPGARIVVYEAPNDERGFLDAVRTATLRRRRSRPRCSRLVTAGPSSLWTPVALEILDELFAAAALSGVSVFCASGDNGAEVDAGGKRARAGAGVQRVRHRVRSDGDRRATPRARGKRRGGGFSDAFRRAGVAAERCGGGVALRRCSRPRVCPTSRRNSRRVITS